MALFKFAGTKADLDQVNVHDGYVYVCTDEEQDRDGDNNPLGEWFVDIGTTRYRLAAAALINPQGTVVNIDDLVQDGDLMEVRVGGTGKTSVTANALLIGDGTNAMKEVASTAGVLQVDEDGDAPMYDTVPVKFGGTGGTTAAAARTKLGVPSTTEMGQAINTAVATASAAPFTLTIDTSDWIAHSTEGTVDYYYTAKNITGVTCGANHNVPPIITLADSETVSKDVQKAYNLIYRATANYNQNTNASAFIFYAEKQPEEVLNLIIVDLR